MREIYIHIGTPKTGSTAIQNALQRNLRRLSRRGVVYVILPTPLLRRIRVLSEPDPEITREASVLINEQVIRDPGAKAILGYEGFVGNTELGYGNAGVVAASLAEITHGWDVHIVVYLRRQDTFIESLYNTSVQGGRTWGFQEFVDTVDAGYFDWSTILDGYARVFGRDRITVRKYQRESLSQSSSILEDFSTATQIPGLLAEPEDLEANRGYSRDALELARLTNKLLQVQDRRRMRHLLQTLNSKDVFADWGLFGPGQRAEFLSRYADSNARIAREYFGQSDGALFTPIQEGIDDSRYPGLSVESASQLLVQLIFSLVAQERAQRQRQAYVAIAKRGLLVMRRFMSKISSR